MQKDVDEKSGECFSLDFVLFCSQKNLTFFSIPFNRRMAPVAWGRLRQCQGGVFVVMRGRGCCLELAATVEKLWGVKKSRGKELGAKVFELVVWRRGE